MIELICSPENERKPKKSQLCISGKMGHTREDMEKSRLLPVIQQLQYVPVT